MSSDIFFVLRNARDNTEKKSNVKFHCNLNIALVITHTDVIKTILGKSYCETPVDFIFKRHFGFEADSILIKCDHQEANGVLMAKQALLNENDKIAVKIRQQITNNTSAEELNSLVNQFCDVDKNIKFLSQNLTNNVQVCLKIAFHDDKKAEILREFVTNICAAIYNEFRLLLQGSN